jgi:cytochrome c oxidase assembly protein subunit 15
LAVAAAALLFTDIILGVQLRHANLTESPGWFVLWLWLKLIVAGAAALAAALAWRDARRLPDVPVLKGRARLLGLLVAVQLLLGAATWLVNYGVPAWFRDYVWAAEYTVDAAGRWQVNVTTAHVAVGSLALATAASLAVWSYRLLERPAR